MRDALALIRIDIIKAVKTLCLKKNEDWVCIAPCGHEGYCDPVKGMDFVIAHQIKFGRPR